VLPDIFHRMEMIRLKTGMRKHGVDRTDEALRVI
jgi:hypothetical protein